MFPASHSHLRMLDLRTSYLLNESNFYWSQLTRAHDGVAGISQCPAELPQSHGGVTQQEVGGACKLEQVSSAGGLPEDPGRGLQL